MNSIFVRRTLIAAPLLSLLLLSNGPAQAQNRKGAGLKHAEAILGKPLNDAQKKAVKAANTKRQEEIKPIQVKYRTTVAKALGLTLTQYEEREAKLRQKGKKAE